MHMRAMAGYAHTCALGQCIRLCTGRACAWGTRTRLRTQRFTACVRVTSSRIHETRLPIRDGEILGWEGPRFIKNVELCIVCCAYVCVRGEYACACVSTLCVRVRTEAERCAYVCVRVLTRTYVLGSSSESMRVEHAHAIAHATLSCVRVILSPTHTRDRGFNVTLPVRRSYGSLQSSWIPWLDSAWTCVRTVHS